MQNRIILKVPKKKEDIKLLILDAAKKLFVTKGYKATSLRNIAAEIGYSPTAIYIYYKDKNDIIYSLHQSGFEKMKNMFTLLADVESPFERLKTMGKGYLRFAKEQPEFYELMFMMKEPMQFLDDEQGLPWDEGNDVFNLIINTIGACQAEGYFPNSTAEKVALQAWGLVHGLCSLYITTRLQKLGEINLGLHPSDQLLDIAFDAYVDLVEQNKVEINN